MLLSAHQPHYLPWLKYFDKIARSDLFVLLDDIQYNKGGFQNRNFLKGPTGRVRLTVPVKHKYKQLLNDVKIADNRLWEEKHLQSIKTCYGQAPFFSCYRTFFENIYSIEWESLNELNEKMLSFFISTLNITTRIIKYSELKLGSKINVDMPGTDRLILLAKELGADAYLAGAYGVGAYLDVCKMEKAGIKVFLQKWEPPIYRQQFSSIGFYKDLSIVDLLFNEGANSLKILLEGGGVHAHSTF